MFPCNSLTLHPCMKRILNLTLAVLLSLTANAQTKADSLRADSIYKSMELQGVEVVKQKSLVKADIDKISYDIESDPDSKTNSVMEMLRKVPMVTVDGEDNIQVNGSSSFKVYVNSKPNNLMTNNPKEVLKSMPANSIKKIEVITNPGPKYDAEGVGGILNIITHGSGLEGYTVTLSGNVSNQAAGGGVYGTVKAGKLTVSGNYNLNWDDNPRSYSGGSRKTIGTIGTSSSDISYDGNSKNHGNFQYGSFEASYEIDTLRLITASLGLWGGGNKSNSDMLTQATHPSTLAQLYRYQTAGHSNSSWYSIDGGIDYQRSFPVKGRLLTLSYKIDTNPSSSDSYTDYLDKQSDAAWDDFLDRLHDQHTDGSQRTTEHTFQADYTTPFAKLHTIEAGLKYILRNNSSENDRYEMGTFDENHSSHYKHRNDILAAYLGYGIKLKKWSGRMGLRYEHTLQDVDYELGRGQDFKKRFNDWVPSASIGWKPTQMSNLQLNYYMRIHRPGIWYLNPYLNDANPTSISQGNSRLDNEKSHSFVLSYSNFTPKLNFNASLRYGTTNNSIERVTRLVRDTDIPGLQNPTGKDVLYATYENIGHSKYVNLTAYVNWNATRNTRIYVNSRLTYTDMNDGGTLHNYGWDLFAYGGAQQTLPKDFRISLNFFGMTPRFNLQGRGSSYASYTLSLNKSWLNKRLNVGLSATNFLKKYRISESSLQDISFLQDSWSRFTQQRFSLSISYRFGELKASVRKAERTISNDDLKGGGSRGGSGEGNSN